MEKLARITARSLLKKKWQQAFVTAAAVISVTLGFCVVQSAALSESVRDFLYIKTGISAEVIFAVFSVVFSLLVVWPVTLGQKRWCARLKYGQKASLKELFHFFSAPRAYLRAVATGLAVFLKVFSAAAITMTVPAFFFCLAGFLRAQKENEITRILISNALILGIISAFIAAIIFVCLALRTIAVSYLVAADDRIGVTAAVRRSSEIIRKNGRSILMTLLPMAPLCILGVLIFPLFLLIPYFTTVFSQCVKNAV